MPSFLQHAQRLLGRLGSIEDRLDRVQRAVARVELHLQDLRGLTDPVDREMQAYSQWGEDGILQALVRRVPLGRKRFVEFGVEDYRESNTRFLLQHDNWSGLVMDGSASNVERIVSDAISWRQDLSARCAFITRENIDGLLTEAGYDGDLDLLSIDVDGNDYWIWEAVTVAAPRIVVVEYNSAFGPKATCSIPYRADFQRTSAHSSNLYFGASVAAFEHLATKRGYRLVCGNRAGNNLFFVREDLAGDLPRRRAADVWVASRFREMRDERGALLYTRAEEGRRAIEGQRVVDVVTGESHALGEILE
ncbi:MAG: hypothetical protein ABI321_05520 [Polyangia bacterium]